MKKFFLTLLMGVPLVGLWAQSSTTNTQSTTEFKKEAPPSSSEQVKSPISELPGFPVYQNTGNVEKSTSDYLAAKEKWISENQELYTNYLNSLRQKSKISLSDLPGFPQFVNTGNPDVDNANYREAKVLWIQNNQDLYNSFIQNTTPNHNTRTTK